MDIHNNILIIRRSYNNLAEITDGKNANALRSQYLPEIAQKIISFRFNQWDIVPSGIGVNCRH